MSSGSEGHRPVLVVDMGAQYAQLIARRVRECRVTPRSSRMTCRPPRWPRASRRGSSCPAAPPRSTSRAHRTSTRSCSSSACRCWASATACRRWPPALGGTVGNTGIGEYGKTPVRLEEGSLLFGEMPREQTCWMSHRDSVIEVPAGLPRHRVHRDDGDRGDGGPRARPLRACSSIPRCCTRRGAPRCSASSCSRPARCRRPGRRTSSSRSRSSGSAPRWATSA